MKKMEKVETGSMANVMKKGTEMGLKSNYERMDSREEEEDEDLEVKWMQRRRDTKKYVYACAMFASLNSILLGYGKLLPFFRLFLIITMEGKRTVSLNWLYMQYMKSVCRNAC